MKKSVQATLRRLSARTAEELAQPNISAPKAEPASPPKCSLGQIAFESVFPGSWSAMSLSAQQGWERAAARVIEETARQREELAAINAQLSLRREELAAQRDELLACMEMAVRGYINGQDDRARANAAIVAAGGRPCA